MAQAIERCCFSEDTRIGFYSASDRSTARPAASPALMLQTKLTNISLSVDLKKGVALSLIKIRTTLFSYAILERS